MANASAQMLDEASSRMRTRRAPRRKKPSKNLAVPLISIAGLGLVVLFGGKLLASLPGDEPAPAPAAKPVDIGWAHPRVQAAVEWAEAIHSGNDLVLRRRSDATALHDFLGVESAIDLRNANTMERDDFEMEITTELQQGTAARLFREFAPRDGRLGGQSMHDSETGTVTMRLAPREGSIYLRSLEKKGRKYNRRYDAEVEIAFAASDGGIRVTSWEVLSAPPRPAEERVPHATIAKPVTREAEFGGETIVVAESEPVPLDHLEDTPPALRTEIDTLITTLMDPDAPAASANRTIARLKEIGRPAIPRLLDQMHDRSLESLQDRIAMRGIIRALSAMTGQRFGFSVVDKPEAGSGGTDAERESALKQWYAWWYDSFDRDYTTAIDTTEDESLFLTREEKAALPVDEPDAAEATANGKR